MVGPVESGYVATIVELRRFSFSRTAPGSPPGPARPTAPELIFESKVAIDKRKKLIHVTSTLESEPAVAGTPPPDIAVSAEVLVEFVWSGEPALAPQEFARVNAAAFAWPYLRELVWNFTVRGNLPPLLLPLLNFAAQGVMVEERALEPLRRPVARRR